MTENLLLHPITAQSFAIIDREIGVHTLSQPEYEIVRRVIHTTADFEFKDLIKFTETAITNGITALCAGSEIVVDVGMVKQGIVGIIGKTFQNPVINALDYAPAAIPAGQTRAALGMLACMHAYPNAIFVIGNAPTALLTLCDAACGTGKDGKKFAPSLMIGAPVGFVSVLESKAALAQSDFPHIRCEGRKGGSPVAAAIINALVTMAWQRSQESYSTTHSN